MIRKEFKILVTGDFVPGGIYCNTQGYNPLRDIRNFLFENDLIWTNLEVSFPWGEKSIITRSSVVPGELNFFERIIQGNNWLFSLANNHSFDYGLNSLKKTLNYFRNNEINWLGANDIVSEVRNPFILKHEGIRIGFLSYSSKDKWVGDHIGRETGEYISILNENSFNEVKKVKEEVDFLFVGCHFGKEFLHYPLLNDVKIARTLIDNGADAVFGHHAHVIQGYEYYKNKPIFYNLGNFLFPDFKFPQKLVWSKIERIGLVIQICIGEKISYNLIPIRLKKNEEILEVLNGGEKVRILKKLNKYSKPLNNFDSRKYQRKVNLETMLNALNRIIKGIIRNILNPRPKHIKIFYRYIKQIIYGLKNKWEH